MLIGGVSVVLVGPEREFQPANELHGRFWTTRYPSKALLQMRATVAMSQTAPVEAMSIPVLVFYSPADQVLDLTATADTFDRLGSSAKELVVVDSDDPAQHVLAGDILSPRTNDEVVSRSAEFLRRELGLTAESNPEPVREPIP